ncbi:MAG: protein kinase domain-containing protein [Prochlorotrichaceae cyanobacterium]
MITLALLDPLDSATVLQWWSFEEKTEITVGRSSRNDLVIRDPRISRHHIVFNKLPFPSRREEWQLTNLGKNDVAVNGEVTFRGIVPHGGEIQLAPRGPKLCFFLSDQLTAASLLQGNVRRTVTIPQEDTFLPLALPSMDSPSPQSNFADQLAQDFEICEHLDNNPRHLFCSHCGQPLSIQRSIRQYDLVKVLTQSGTGYTFLAWINPIHGDVPIVITDSVVVLKQLSPQSIRNPKQQELFMRQAMTLNRLEHPAIPRFIDFFAEAHQFYLVMEWIPGSSLEDHVRQLGVLSPAQVIACALQICEVLHYLQHQDPPLIHRDIKPSNLIARYRDGRIVLVDFGVVKPLVGMEQTVLNMGGYRAPEQMHGQTFPQSDFFGLGSTLLFLLSGKEPALIHGYQPNSAKYYLEKLPGISLALAETLGYLLHPNPNDRYPTVEALQQGLKVAQQSLR